MKRRLKAVCIIVAAMVSLFCQDAAAGLTINEAVEAIGDYLIGEQLADGSWLEEEGYVGSIVAGLVNAYEVTGNAGYRNAAELGASFIVNEAQGNFYGDEAYALTRLWDVTGEAAYVEAVRDFYNGLETDAYTRYFEQTDPSNAVFYTAQHTVAAVMVGAEDAYIWREALIRYLSFITDDLAYYPVMSLGVATWALAQTGPLNDTLIDPFDLSGDGLWAGVTLSDLPDLLSSHQVINGTYAGSFYESFDHANSGYTEDTVFGILGLIASDSKVGVDYTAEILSGREALAWSVNRSGMVGEHIWNGGAVYYTYGGEVLQAIPEPLSLLLFGAAGWFLCRRRGNNS